VESEYGKKYLELYEWEVKDRMMTLEDENYSDIFTKDIMDLVTKSLAKLPGKTHEIFMKNRFEYQSRKDIAAEMGVSLQKIDYHINKANDHLYKDLKDYLPTLLFFFGNLL
jgi:RNA polymerase sigma-70 factor (ECF subfamily)